MSELASYTDAEIQVLEDLGRRRVVETYFDWMQTHFSEFQEGRRL
ncbi:MAG: hypothetical protein ACOCUO_00405 [archaeon]